MSRTASRITKSMVLPSSGVSRSLVVLFDLGLLYAMIQKSSFVSYHRIKATFKLLIRFSESASDGQRWVEAGIHIGRPER